MKIDNHHRLLGQILRGHASIYDLVTFRDRFGLQSKEAFIFVDNHVSF